MGNWEHLIDKQRLGERSQVDRHRAKLSCRSEGKNNRGRTVSSLELISNAVEQALGDRTFNGLLVPYDDRLAQGGGEGTGHDDSEAA